MAPVQKWLLSFEWLLRIYQQGSFLSEMDWGYKVHKKAIKSLLNDGHIKGFQNMTLFVVLCCSLRLIFKKGKFLFRKTYSEPFSFSVFGCLYHKQTGCYECVKKVPGWKS